MDNDYKPENAIAYAFAVIFLLVLVPFLPAIYDFFTALHDVYAIGSGW